MQLQSRFKQYHFFYSSYSSIYRSRIFEFSFLQPSKEEHDTAQNGRFFLYPSSDGVEYSESNDDAAAEEEDEEYHHDNEKQNIIGVDDDEDAVEDVLLNSLISFPLRIHLRRKFTLLLLLL